MSGAHQKKDAALVSGETPANLKRLSRWGSICFMEADLLRRVGACLLSAGLSSYAAKVAGLLGTKI